jgi:uncharacterized protein (UPF0333 family)
MKAQTGFEYMVILALVIAFLVPLFYMANQSIEVSRATSEAKTAVSAIVNAANTVCVQSPGSKLTAQVFIPAGYDNRTSYVVNKTVLLTVNLADGRMYNAYGYANCNMSGRLPPYNGYHIMTFYHNQSGYAIINTTAK